MRGWPGWFLVLPTPRQVPAAVCSASKIWIPSTTTLQYRGACWHRNAAHCCESFSVNDASEKKCAMATACLIPQVWHSNGWPQRLWFTLIVNEGGYVRYYASFDYRSTKRLL